MIVPLNSAAQHNPPASPFRALFESFIRDFRVQNPSPKTVEVHRAHVMSKMCVDSLAELIRITLLAGEIRENP